MKLLTSLLIVLLTVPCYAQPDINWDDTETMTTEEIIPEVIPEPVIETPSMPSKYYIFIEKNGYVASGEEAGHNEVGDVVEIVPFTPQHKPTAGEKASYTIVVADLTQAQKEALLAPDGSFGIDETTEHSIPKKVWDDPEAKAKYMDENNLNNISFLGTQGDNVIFQSKKQECFATVRARKSKIDTSKLGISKNEEEVSVQKITDSLSIKPSLVSP